MDTRLGAAKHVSTPWALRRYRTLAEWEQRATAIRRHILVCAGLWPLPEKTPLKAQVFGRIERDGYAVEKVFFESLTGFFVCGNLYRPLERGAFPGACLSARPLGAGASGKHRTGIDCWALHQLCAAGHGGLFVRHGWVQRQRPIRASGDWGAARGSVGNRRVEFATVEQHASGGLPLHRWRM